MTVSNCIACNRQIRGRQDKKFCNDSCRNNYNNVVNSDAEKLIRNTNTILRKNRRILVGFLGGVDKPLLVDRNALLVKGFRFEFFTGQFRNDKNEVYYYCYDYGYRMLNAEKVMVVKNKQRSPKTNPTR
jgi:hypothetical protein